MIGKQRARCVCGRRRMPESEAELQYLRRALPLANRKLGIPDAAGDPVSAIPRFEVALEDIPATRAVIAEFAITSARDLGIAPRYATWRTD